MAPKSGTRHTWPGRPPQSTTDGGRTRGTKIWHHRHTWPNRPPLQPTIEGATREAPKSGTTNAYGQIGPPPIAHIEGVTTVAPKSGTTNMYGQIGPPENNTNKTKKKRKSRKWYCLLATMTADHCCSRQYQWRSKYLTYCCCRQQYTKYELRPSTNRRKNEQKK